MKALFFVAILLLAFSVNAMMTPDLWQERVIKGLSKVATGERIIPDILAWEAQEILLKWFNIKVTCTEPNEKMWDSYCQEQYRIGGVNCAALSAENKAGLMKNMRQCIIRR
jgi:hypothetical protein